MSVLLSICIPTYNRIKYLRELVPTVMAQLEIINRETVRVELIISDNASTDETDSFLTGLSCPGLRCYRNSANIGGDRNFLVCIGRAVGEYIWLFGDDELIIPNSISRIIDFLSREHPALLVLNGDGHAPDHSPEIIYEDYGVCVRENMKQSKGFPLSHTLITSNVFLKNVFNVEKAEAMLFTNYAHMFGLMAGLEGGGRVAVTSDGYLPREQRAHFDQWPTALCLKQAGYLWWIAGHFKIPRLRRLALYVASNLPKEILSRCARRIIPKRFWKN